MAMGFLMSHGESEKSYFFMWKKYDASYVLDRATWEQNNILPWEGSILCSGRSLEKPPSRVPGWITSRCHTQVLPELPRDPWSSDFSLNIALWKNYAGQMSEKRGWKGWKLHQQNGWTRWKQNRQDGNREELTSEQPTEISAYKEGTLLLNPL